MNCEKCGQPLAPGATFCENCGHANDVPAQAAVEGIQAPQVELKRPENFALGIVGALVGALLGAASIILFGQLGYISALSGLILAFCTVKGYELLAKGLSVKGIVVCVLLIAITPYFADRLNWAMWFQQTARYADIPLTNLFAAVHQLFDTHPELAPEYWRNLGMTYLFAALGAFGILKGMFSKKK